MERVRWASPVHFLGFGEPRLGVFGDAAIQGQVAQVVVGDRQRMLMVGMVGELLQQLDKHSAQRS